MLKRILLTAIIAFCCLPAAATTTVTANLKSALGTAYQSDAFVRFRLRGYSGSVPRVSGGVIVVTIPDVSPDANGLVSTALYNNYEITPAGTYWTVEYWAGGEMKSTANYTICTITSGACSAGIGSYDLNSATANTVPPVVNPPTGDSTYLELTAGNGPLTNKLGILTGDQAKQVSLSAVSPQGLAIQEGTSASPVADYQTKPQVYLSRFSNTDESGCITGMAAPCLDPMIRIDATNANTTTTGDLVGVIANLWGAKANTSPATWGSQWIGGAYMMADSTTVNKVEMTGLNPNITAQSTPLACVKGTAGVDTTCARVMNGLESDMANATAVDAVLDSSIGNSTYGATFNSYSTNAAPADNSVGIATATGTVGHGWKFAGVFGGSKTVGLLVPQQGISNKPDIAIHIASQGAFGLVCGSGSQTYTKALSWDLSNPSTACQLFDVARLYGGSGSAASTVEQFRSSSGGTTYFNWRSFIDNTGVFHWQTDKSGSFVDGMIFAPNATAANASLQITGSVIASNAVYIHNTGSAAFILNGTPTGNRAILIQDADQTLVGRDTTDTLTNKTLTAPIITAPSITGIGSAGKAMCWKTASTLGFCSTVVDAAGACTCN